MEPYFTTPNSHNFPMSNDKHFYVGFNKLSGLPLPDNVPREGKYRFGIPQLKYDGIYSQDNRIHNKVETTKWELNNSKPAGFYGANQLFHLPEIPFKDGMRCDNTGWREKVKLGECTLPREEIYKQNPPTIANNPPFVDKWGVIPQDNSFTYMPLPKVNCAPFNFIPQ